MKRGFTLAELLIAISIVGVVSALTIPALVVNVQKNSVGASLSKATNTLATASKMLIASGGYATTKISHVACTSNFPERLKHYAKLHQIDAAEVPVYTDYNGSAPSETAKYKNDATCQDHAYITDEGMLFIFSEGTPEDTSYSVFVDVNGTEPPNSLGKDLFLLVVDDDGTVIPYGSRRGCALNYTTNVGYDANIGCAATDPCTKGNVSTGVTCAGAVADNNWKVLY